MASCCSLRIADALSNWHSQTRRPIRVGVQAVKVQVPDLTSAGATPASDNQRCSLVGTCELSYRMNESIELIGRDVARNAFGSLRQVSRTEQWSSGSLFPSDVGSTKAM